MAIFDFDDGLLEILAGREGKGPQTALSTFCCGGVMDMGLAWGGIKILQSYDWNEQAVAACRLNNGHGKELDLTDTQEALPVIRRDLGGRRLDGVVGGPPCTDYSKCGDRKEDKAARLTVSYAEIIDGLRPTWILMENVAEALTSDTFTKIARPTLKEVGYGLSHVVLDTSYNLVPQARERVLLFGFLGAEDGELDPLLKLAFRHDPYETHRGKRPERRRKLAERGERDPFETTVADVLPEIGTPFLTRRTRNKGSRAVFSIHEPYPTQVAQRRGEQNAKTYVPKRADAGPLSQSREPTWEEKKVIQGMPPEYRFPDGFAEEDKQYVIGNSLPPIIAQQAAWVLNRKTDELEAKKASVAAE